MEAADFMVFAAFAAILAVLLIGGTLAAAPIRRKMVVVANELYETPGASDQLKRRIDFLLDTALSPLISVLLIVASIATLIDCIFFSENEPAPEFQQDPRYSNLVGLYFGSVMLANPLAAIILLPLILLCALIHSGVKSLRGAQLADAQINRVEHSRLARA